MKKLSETLKELGIAFCFPIEINDAKGKETYFETSDGNWCKREYDAKGKETYFEYSNGCWCKREYDSSGNVTLYENSEGCWWKHEYDANGDETYFEAYNGCKKGTPKSAKNCDGKVVEVDGIKYELKAL